MRIARCTPSRGLVHSRTEEAAEYGRLMAEARGHTWRSFLSHDKPIPDCFNDVTWRAWAWGADLFWLLEEDVAPVEPVKAFENMLDAIEGADYVTTTYPIGQLDSERNASPLNYDGAGRLVWCATGCILLRRVCFELMPEPWFTLRNRLVKPGRITWDHGTDSPYGCDIGFTFALYQLGLRAALVEDEIHHFRVRQSGDREINTGVHIIEPLSWGTGRTKCQF